MNRITQGTFDLWPAGPQLAFLRGPRTDAAIGAVERWVETSGAASPVLALTGDAGVGKSRLLDRLGQRYGVDIFTGSALSGVPDDSQADVVAIDDADRADPMLLFAWWNACRAGETPLLLCAERKPADWSLALDPVRMKDLSSRLESIPVVQLPAPDTSMMQRALNTALRSVGLNLSETDVAWAAPRLRPRFHHALTIARAAATLAGDAPAGRTLLRRAMEDNPEACRQ